jgi:lipid-binding SYLF domain-containing protein
MLGRTFLIFALLVSATADAATKQVIDSRVAAALKEFKNKSPAGSILMRKAKGILVFPKVVKAGFGVGGEFGEGALLMGGRTVGYYSIASGSFGFQFGAQVKKEVILFLDHGALKEFRASDGWQTGVDGGIALVEFGAEGGIDTNTARDPIVGFVFSHKGLMYNLSFEGSKISKIER